MRTKRSRTILLIILSQLASMATCRSLRAAAPDDAAGTRQSPARPVIQKPLTREDAELLLREAHGLIEQGRLDDADKILSRVENAHVQYPLFHVGPSPASLRKELTHAERLRAARKSLSHDQPEGASRYLPFSRNTSGQGNATSDPFLTRNRAGGEMPATSGNVTQHDAPIAEHRLAAVAAPTTLALDSPSPRAQRLDNPFASAGRPLSLPSANSSNEPSSSESPLNYPSTHPASDDDSRHLAASPAHSLADSTLPESSSSNPSWALPSAPLPRGTSDQRFTEANSGLMPPRHLAADSSTNESRLPSSTTKQQAQEKLSAAQGPAIRRH